MVPGCRRRALPDDASRVGSGPSSVGLAVAAGSRWCPRSRRRPRCAPGRYVRRLHHDGTNPKPLPKPPAPTWLVKYKVWSNHIKIYKNGDLVRDVPVAGNPYLSPHLPSELPHRAEAAHQLGQDRVWRLDYFTRLCAGRGVGAHGSRSTATTGASA